MNFFGRFISFRLACVIYYIFACVRYYVYIDIHISALIIPLIYHEVNSCRG